MSGLQLLCLITGFSVVTAVPIVLKGSSPSGETVIAISSSDPNVERYISLNFPNKGETSEETDLNPADLFQKTFSTAIAGTNTSTGRGFSSFNPFTLPFFNFPLNFEGFGLSFGPWMRGVEGHDGGNGGVTATAVNDNGHVYGKINGVTFDNARKRS